jgi:protein phosphatase
MLTFESAKRTSKGARSYQEDAAEVRPGPAGDGGGPQSLVAVLADGMGGHTGGALASRMVCESFLAAYGGFGSDELGPLRQALDTANRAIAQKVHQSPHLSGMGSTLVGAVFGPEGLEWVSVGDSPLYLFRRGEIALLNEDHSLAPALDQMAAEGRMSAEEARNDPRRHMLRSALTGEELELVDESRKPLALEAGDYVVLASDGIHTIDDAEIARVVAAYGEDGPDAVAAALIRAVEQVRDPHQDNITVVVIRPRKAEARETSRGSE